MKNIIILAIVLSSLPAFGCDICGCKLGGLNFGILPQFNNHFIGIKYSRANFNAAIKYNSDYLQDEFSEDTYQRLDLVGRYVLSTKWQINVIAPYLINQMDGSHQKINSSGIGDPMVMAFYQIANNGDNIISKWKHAILVGAGFKFPLGQFQRKDQGEIINRNFQLGSGSLDYLLSVNYTLRRGALGLNVESGYKINNRNSDDYCFGNQLNISSFLFYWLEIGKISILPYAGAYFEHAAKHNNSNVQEMNTGGHALFNTLGLQLYKGNFTLNIQHQIPINQKYNAEQIASINAENRSSISLIYNIKRKEKGFPIPVN